MNQIYLNILDESSVFGSYLANFAMKLGFNENRNSI